MFSRATDNLWEPDRFRVSNSCIDFEGGLPLKKLGSPAPKQASLLLCWVWKCGWLAGCLSGWQNRFLVSSPAVRVKLNNYSRVRCELHLPPKSLWTIFSSKYAVQHDDLTTARGPPARKCAYSAYTAT